MAPPPRKRPTSTRSASRNESSNGAKRAATLQNAAAGKKAIAAKEKNVIQKQLSTHGFSSTARPRYNKGPKICLNDSIFKSAIPAEVKGHLFVYEICEVHENGKTISVMFKDQVIAPDGDRFRVYKEGEETQVRIRCAHLYFFYPIHSSCLYFSVYDS